MPNAPAGVKPRGFRNRRIKDCIRDGVALLIARDETAHERLLRKSTGQVMTKHSHPPSNGGIGQVLRVALPLIMASSGHAFRLFADRVMLARYSQAAIAAAMPAGLTCFCLMCFFLGTAGYAGTFVAQYAGADRKERTGLAVWQGIYIALAGGLVVGLIAPAARLIFQWMGHGEVVLEQQVIYFQVLARLSFATILLAAMNSFWSGRGKTVVVMVIELVCAAANIILNYMLIFGNWGCPELGILGAGLATGLSSMLGLAIALALFFSPANRRQFGTLPHRTLDLPLLRRLLHFGSPNGIQFALDLTAFNLFVILLGRLGTVELEAANMAFAINGMVYLPMIGLGMTVSILVGQCIGGQRPGEARRAVRSALILALVCNAAVGLVMLVFPRVLLVLFARPADPSQLQALETAIIYMRYITAYLVFDGFYIVFSHAIRGAGDTRFAMRAGLAMSWGTLVLPTFIAHCTGASAHVIWSILVCHVLLASVVFLARYRTGNWVHMRVIEEVPTAELEIQADRGI
jgi:MATE family multidrug resistance protein